MSLVYKRLGAQGEIHLTSNKNKTLCGITCTHANWIDWPQVDDKYPQLCPECLSAKSENSPVAKEKSTAKSSTKPKEKAKPKKKPTQKKASKAETKPKENEKETKKSKKADSKNSDDEASE